MTGPPETPVTQLLQAMERGDENASEELLHLLYDELHRMAEVQMGGTPPGQTLQPTALVNEAYLRMVGEDRQGWENRRHFFFVAARAMHDILVEQARSRATKKRGGDWNRVEAKNLELPIEAPAADMLALDEALSRLESEDPRRAQLVHLRFFAGLSEHETAEVLGISKRTVQREWRYIRVRLYTELGELSEPGPGDGERR